MPFVSETTLAKFKGAYSKAHSKAESVTGQVKTAGEILAGAVAAGAARGYMERSGKTLNIPGTTVDAVPVLAGVAVGLSMFNTFGKYDEDAANFAMGALAHWSGQIARNSVKAGNLQMIAGADDDLAAQMAQLSGV